MPRPLITPTSTFPAPSPSSPTVLRVSMKAVRLPDRSLVSLLSSTTRVSMPESTSKPRSSLGLPTITSGPMPKGGSSPGREVWLTPVSRCAVVPTLIRSLPAPPSTRTGTVVLLLSTMMLSSPELPRSVRESSSSAAPGAT